MIKIDMFNFNSFKREIELNDVVYFLVFNWNSTAKYWEFSIQNANNKALIQGLPIIANTLLLKGVFNKELPVGDFIAQVSAGNQIDRNSFYNNISAFYYLEPSEVNNG